LLNSLQQRGFGIKYEDTDSLYLTCPDKYYETCDRVFNKDELSKEAYWTEMVKITIEVMDEFHNKVNAYLRIKNSTSYLKIAYEKVLFPMYFTGKKKYFRIGHEEVVNFKPKSLFTKRIDTIKQGQSQLFKFIEEKIIWEAMDINNTRSIHKIVEDILRKTSLKQWGFDQFIAIATWKPNKDNKCIQYFIRWMKEKYKISDSDEHFSYIVVKGVPFMMKIVKSNHAELQTTWSFQTLQKNSI